MRVVRFLCPRRGPFLRVRFVNEPVLLLLRFLYGRDPGGAILLFNSRLLIPFPSCLPVSGSPLLVNRFIACEANSPAILVAAALT